MKQLLSFITVSSLFLLIGCDKSAPILADVAGTWILQEVKLSGVSSTDSTFTVAKTQLSFTPCTSSTNSGSPSCSATLSIVNATATTNIDLKYQLNRASNGNFLAINNTKEITDTETSKRVNLVASTHKATTLDEKNLVLEYENTLGETYNGYRFTKRILKFTK
jgi:hypothetical protein